MRLLVGGVVGLLLATVVAGADEGKEKAESTKPGTPAEQFKALVKDFEGTIGKLQDEFRAAKDAEAKTKIRTQAMEMLNTYAGKAVELAEKNPKDEAAVSALIWALERARSDAARNKIMDVLTRDQVQSKGAAKICAAVADVPSPNVEKFLRAVMEKNPERDAQGLACLSLATNFQTRAEEAEGPEADKLNKEAEKLLDQAVAKYGDVKTDDGTVGATAKALLGLAIGRVAPDIVGEDGEDKKFKLSDYRGKVVMIDFWAGWCGPCMGLVPHNRALVKKMEGKPFVLLGVNEDQSKAELKKVAEQAQINWRSFFDAGGKIAQDWRIKGFPTMLVLDHKGVMRFKIVGGGEANAKSVEEVVEKLVKEAEADKGAK